MQKTKQNNIVRHLHRRTIHEDSWRSASCASSVLLSISLSPLWHAIVEKSMRILAWSLILILRRSQGDTTYSQNASCQTESHFCILPSSTRHSARVTGRHSFINIGVILRTFYELHSTMLEHSLKVLTQFEVSKSFLVDWTVQNWTETVNAISQPCYVSNALLKPWRPCCVSGRHARHLGIGGNLRFRSSWTLNLLSQK